MHTAAGYWYRFPMTSVATDIVVFQVTARGELQIALVRRRADADAYPGVWALPGGFFKPDEDEDVTACVLRELHEEAGILLAKLEVGQPHVELVGVYSAKGRDPRPERVISIAHLVVLPEGQLTLAPIKDTDVSEARWFPMDALATLDLAFDHHRIIEDARRRLADRMTYARKDEDNPELLFAFLPETFTLGDAQAVMQALKGEPVDKSNFRKYIDRFVVATGRSVPMRTRPAALYRRRSADQADDAGLLSGGLARLRKLADDQRIHNFEFFLSAMASAPDEAVRMVGRLLVVYGRHRDYLLKATRVPDVRIDDERTGRVLLTLKWQPQKQGFLCTALSPPPALRALKLRDLRDWNTGPHKSVFRLGFSEDELDRLDAVLAQSAACLGVQ